MSVDNLKVLMYINMCYILPNDQNILNVTSLIMYASKTLPIFHHIVNKSEKGEEANFEINRVILR